MQHANPCEFAQRIAKRAEQGLLTGHEIWRALKNINNDLYHIERFGLPVPIQLLRTRRILVDAQTRGKGC